MRRRRFLSILVQTSTAGCIGCVATGCGSLLHRERCGHPHSHQLDWKIVAMNGLGLILFFVPGVVAFAVDFYTGAIYLPPEHVHPPYGALPKAAESQLTSTEHQAPQQTSDAFRRVVLTGKQLELADIEKAVSEEIGQSFSLRSDQSRVSQLTQIDQFDERLRQHQTDRQFGHSVRAFFSSWSLERRA